jgi:hypothetical protein
MPTLTPRSQNETVMNPGSLPEDSDWDSNPTSDLDSDSDSDSEPPPFPIKELCELLEGADREGIPVDAIYALRAHSGEWDKISVWRMAKNIGLRPPEISRDHQNYPGHVWQTDPGWIVCWPWDRSHFHRVVRLPFRGFASSKRELEHIKSFEVRIGYGTGGSGGRFKPTNDDLWE